MARHTERGLEVDEDKDAARAESKRGGWSVAGAFSKKVPPPLLPPEEKPARASVPRPHRAYVPPAGSTAFWAVTGLEEHPPEDAPCPVGAKWVSKWIPMPGLNGAVATRLWWRRYYLAPDPMENLRSPVRKEE